MNKNTKIQINIHMFIFLNIALIAIFTDIICFFTNIEYSISLFTSIIITLFLNLTSKSKIFNIKLDFEKIDIIPIIIILLLSIFKLCQIDKSIDSITYHFTSQINPFLDNINKDFLPSSVFFFPLGDRINYIFVHFLGNRFGSILTCYAMIILYYQAKNIIQTIIPNLSKLKRTFFLLILITSVSVIIYPGTYFIDNYSSIIIFELIYIFVQNINLIKYKKYLYFSAFLSGCLIGIKVSNIFLALPIIILLLIKNIKKDSFTIIKNITLLDCLFLIAIALFPFFVYLLRGYLQTKNPFFPLINNIFHSPFLKDTNGFDARLGPKNFLEFICWPIIISFNMIRGNDIYGLVENTWGIGYLLLIYSLFNYKKNTKELNSFTILVTLLTFIWIKFLFGYVRYGLALSFCYYIIVFYYLNKFKISKLKSITTIRSALIHFAIFVLIIIFFVLHFVVNFSYYYSYCKSIIKVNQPYSNQYEEIISAPYDIENGIWLCTRYNNYYTTLLRDESDYMYNLDIITPQDPMCGWESKYSDYSQNIFNKKIQNKDLYIAIPYTYHNYVLELLEINNLKISETIGIYSNTKYMNPFDYITIVKVEFKN